MVKIPVKPESNSQQASQLKTVALDVGGMKCAGCVGAVERQLKNNPGVESACVNLITEVAVVEYEAQAINPQALAEKLTETGFPSQIRNRDRSVAEVTNQAQAKRQQQQKKQLWQLITAAILLVFSSIGHLHHLGFPMIPVLSNIWFHWGLATLALLIPGRNLLLDGARSLSHGMPNMNTLVGLGTVSAYSTSCLALWFPQLGWECFFDEPVMLLGFILLGRTLEGRARNQASAALEKLVSLQPAMARLTSENDATEDIKIPVEQVKVGEWLRVLPGETIPVDGEITAGETTINESMLTGESVPVGKSKGDRVFAGTINQQGMITFQVSNVGGETTLAKIINLVESAQTRKAPVQQLADTVAGYFAYGVMAIATITFLFWYFWGTHIWEQVLVVEPHDGMSITTSPLLLSIKIAIAVLVVACPCALGLATPTAILVGTSIGAEKGILIKGGDILERVEKLDTVVFDKTGTLTVGKLQVTDCVSLADISTESLLHLSASLESNSNHPLAKAIVEATPQQKLLPTSKIEEKAGFGMIGDIAEDTIVIGNQEWLQQHQIEMGITDSEKADDLINSGQNLVYIAKNKQLIGLIALNDSLRPQAKEIISKLQHKGLNTVLLTGDRKKVAEKIASHLSISQVFAQVKPEDKAKLIKSLQNNNSQVVAMVGDGINDAVALAQADIGISLQGSTDIAMETADIVLMQNNLTDIMEAIDLSQATVRKIKQNLLWALGYNAIAIPLAAGIALPSTGLSLSPILAAIAMASSSLIVVSNSLLLRWKPVTSSLSLLRASHSHE
ncbi:putative copper-transporting ATPase SynA [Hyella patelloides LEGE 07179]|uniref:Putative copper-transporting ATPase SynA n=1 Tax=Hyella patelloides LEGE 07179 TaxID=945734 RepID=A0A563VLA3_9CYAN|nr:heavy metal translocating P-type ATPase [Hyella patelloides]VEP12113.1 putative copper-transporting ATPase SynA [Hyella patelloides LEGE 07179]